MKETFVRAIIARSKIYVNAALKFLMKMLIAMGFGNILTVSMFLKRGVQPFCDILTAFIPPLSALAQNIS